MEMEEERRARMKKMVATAQLMLALIKGVVDVGGFFPSNPFWKVGNYAYHLNLMF